MIIAACGRHSMPVIAAQVTDGPDFVQVAKHTPELAQLVVGAGGVGALVDYVAATKGNTRLPGIMALGYIAAFSETLGLAVIAEKGLVSLCISPVSSAALMLVCWRQWSMQC